jgi:hypothetical protein
MFRTQAAAMKTKTHFQFRLDLWDAAGENIVEHVAGLDDFDIATAAYRAALARWSELMSDPATRRTHCA